MIVYGKKLNKKNLPTTDLLYTLHNERGGVQTILLSLDKSLQDRIQDLKIDNAIVKKEQNCYRFWVGDRKIVRDKNSYYYSNGIPGDFARDITVIRAGQIHRYGKLCEICSDKLKGIVDECVAPNHWNPSQMEKACVFNLNVTVTSMDLSNMREISNGMLSVEKPFRQYHELDKLSFDMGVIKKNIGLYASRYDCGKNKAKKLKKYCPDCIFSCESRLINTENVGNKCQLTYDMALKSGFFKDLKFHYSTSIYREGVYINDEKMNGWQKRIALTENKYNKTK